MRSHNGSNGTPLDPPLVWLDNIFKELAHFCSQRGFLHVPTTQIYCLTGAIIGKTHIYY
jgi:hypothetical protein